MSDYKKVTTLTKSEVCKSTPSGKSENKKRRKEKKKKKKEKEEGRKKLTDV
jgi:hypothetical protein